MLTWNEIDWIWPGSVCDLDVPYPATWGVLPLMLALTCLTTILLWRALKREGVDYDCRLGRDLVIDGLRASIFFMAGCALSTFTAILYPCIFLLDRFFVGLFYWLSSFVSLLLFAIWRVRSSKKSKREDLGMLEEWSRHD